ncbi:L,D-transpeptidase family protein [Stappia sp. ES.058]|uniref:L,D-transpeptidase family protein n=1 Tax=Stappia sp. ES.058 TaxID=1881061 RepID=UPI00156190E9|nr:L,D-transpeptidase family protein [Stappia sp. ES.058]
MSKMTVKIAESDRRHRRAFAMRGAVLGMAMALAATPVMARDTKPLEPLAGETANAGPAMLAEAPVQILVSLKDQTLDVYRGTQLVESTRISSGKRGYGTPTGIFSILEKRRRHFSNLYNDAPMPYMQRLTWSGIALHEGRVPNYPASHGCIRLPRGFARDLFGRTERGGHVIVTRERTRPEGILHAALPRSGAMATEFASLDADAVLLRPALPGAASDNEPATVGSIDRAAEPRAEPRDPLRILITRTTPRERLRDMQRVLDELGYAPGPVDGVMGRKTRAAIRLFQEGAELPVTGEATDLVLRALYSAAGETGPATGRLYVRRKFKEIYSANIVLKDPDAPIGTHIYTVIDDGGTVSAPRWMSVTAAATQGGDAHGILSRVEWTPQARAFVEDRLALGSSLIVTDRPFRLHSGLGTDFVVTTRQ